MLASVTAFADELRRAKVPVSLTETLDAERALVTLPLAGPTALRAALRACLVKDSSHLPVFDVLFDVFFQAAPGPARAPAEAGGGGTDGFGEYDPSAALPAALAAGDLVALGALARALVERYAGIEAGRPVGASYYLARVLRATDLDGVLLALLGAGEVEGSAADPLARRFRREQLAAAAEELRRAVEREITRQLAAERGAALLSAQMRPALLEDVDFMHASRQQLAAMRRVLQPLARALAARLARRRRHHRHGTLDFRGTIRRSLSTGGVPAVVRLRAPRRAKPDLVVLADVSGSVATFARFTLHLVHALAAQFSAVRTFVFVDGVDEVTRQFRHSRSIVEAIERVEREAAVCEADGHSDYGAALTRFSERHLAALGPRTTVLVLGDARGNYHPARPEILAEIARRAHRLYWLNPEPRAYWGSGDSLVAQYAPCCDAMVECRNLRQLAAFVDLLA